MDITRSVHEYYDGGVAKYLDIHFPNNFIIRLDGVGELDIMIESLTKIREMLKDGDIVVNEGRKVDNFDFMVKEPPLEWYKARIALLEKHLQAMLDAFVAPRWTEWISANTALHKKEGI